MCVSKVQHVTGRKTGCNRSRPVFFGFSIFRQTSQLATEKIQNLCNRNRWSGLFRLGSVRFRSFFQSSELDLRTLIAHARTAPGIPAHSLEQSNAPKSSENTPWNQGVSKKMRNIKPQNKMGEHSLKPRNLLIQGSDIQMVVHASKVSNKRI